MLKKFAQYKFLFEELVKRDFNKKYKRAALGVLWSVLSPVLTLLVMKVVFTQFFGRDTLHYTTYLFAGNIVFGYFRESTTGAMTSLTGNKEIITKVNVPKYLFVFSNNITSLINFLLTLVVFFVFVALDGITFSWRFFALLYPIITLSFFCVGMSLILSALYVFFRDMQYLYTVFVRLLSYMSAIFYYVDRYPESVQRWFLINPVYVHIKYFRIVVMENVIPSMQYHLLLLGYTLAVVIIGFFMYKKNNQRFLYYM